MKFPQPLQPGVLVRRYKRFFADVALDSGQEITAHCPNPGAMLGISAAGSAVWVSRSADPKRKLPYTLEIVDACGALVGVNTLLPNRLTEEALTYGSIAELAGYRAIRREVRYGEASRVDFLLDDPARPPCWVEVKGVTLMRGGGLAEFPDCVTSRGLKHLGDLARQVQAGHRAVLLFVAQRADCVDFEAAGDLDPAYGAGLIAAARAGVEVLVYDCDISPTEIRIARALPWRSAQLEPA